MVVSGRWLVKPSDNRQLITDYSDPSTSLGMPPAGSDARKSASLARSCRLAFGGAGENSEHFLFAHDDVVFAVELDFSAAVFAEKNAVAFLHIERADLAFLVDLAFAGGDNFALLWLLFG